MTKSKIEKKVFIRNNWRAGYIEMCKSGSEGGIQRPTLRTKQGVGCLPYFNQSVGQGWKIKRGSKGTDVLLRKPTVGTDENGKREITAVLQRTFTVFHASQIEGSPEYVPPEVNIIEAHEKAERIIDDSGAKIVFGGSKAFYSPNGDYIQLPPKTDFKSADGYY